MTIRFAARRSSIPGRMEGEDVLMAMPLPANDNIARHTSQTMVHAALRHFADHGLAAAHHARKQAEQACETDDEQGYKYWLEICRALDRRMARELENLTIGERQINAN